MRALATAAAPAPATSRPADLTSELADAAILVIDDEPGMRNFLAKTIKGSCARLDVAAGTEEGTALLDAQSYDVIVLDNVMPGQTGVEWLTEQRAIGLYSDAILITAHADLDTAIAALRAGASDFLLKPFRGNQILNALANSLRRKRMRRQNTVLSHELETGSDGLRRSATLLGSSPQMDGVREAVDRASATPSAVLITGEVGTGKQTAARMLHAGSPRRAGPFLWVQCHGLTEERFRAKLLGRIGTGMEADEEGVLMTASGGTLFLDDVDTLSPVCQNILMEILATGRFRPQGATRSQPLEVRMVSSCTTPLRTAVEAGHFRADLFYRLCVVEIVVPALRERSADILELAEFFLAELAARTGLKVPQPSTAERRRLLTYDWPGNVVELRNAAERALIRGGFDVGGKELPADEEIETLEAVERRHILRALEVCGGNRAEAARQLGVARKTIDRKCQA
ncbi:MAG: sigma-54 dependent transcriptional regulator, partial [Pseudomonadota bacterium]